jgi:uncharacterized protein YeaO (DUF488 family)
MAIRIVRLGAPREPGEGPRFATVRRPPQANFSLGCYCADESRCHRSLLRQLLVDAGATVL